MCRSRHLTIILLISFGACILVISLSYLAVAAHSQSSTKSSTLKWLSTTSLPVTLADHSSVAYQNTIYVMGGYTNASQIATDSVYYAIIGSDGQLGGWIITTPLPKKLYGATAAVDANGWIYVTGGYNNIDGVLGTTYYAKPDSLVGTIDGWAESAFTFPKRDYHASVITGTYIYVIGGWNGRSVLDTVLYAPINPDHGGITDVWREAQVLPTPLAGHSAVVHGNNVYVSGGWNASGASAKVYSGTINLNTGHIGTWTPLTSTLPISLHLHSAVVPNGKICVIGGYKRINPSTIEIYSTTYTASINSDGTLEQWKEESPLPLPMHRHTAVMDSSGRIYVVGGKSYEGCENGVYYTPLISFTKSNDPSGPVHEGDIITYTISYANTGLVTQTGVVITDRIPSNTELVSVSSPPTHEIVANSVISWTIGDLDVGETGVVSFQVRVPLLPSLSQSVDMLSSMGEYPPAQVLPVAIACDTTRFWAIGVTRQPPEPIPHTIQVQIPPGASPSEMWLLMKETDNISPTVGGQPAQLVRTSSNSFGASLWTAPITSAMVASGEVTVVTHNPRQLNALFLFDANDPPFEEAALDDFYNITKTFTYALDIPSVETQTIDVILPFMDITYWKDDLPHDPRLTEITVEFDGQSHTVWVNDPNLGNGLLMTQFPFTIGPLDTITTTKVLTVTVDTEDSVYTLGPRVCRPVYIKNTAWLCSDQVGCVSDTVTNIPNGFMPPGRIYLPLILKSSP